MVGLAALGACTEQPEPSDSFPADLVLELDGLQFWQHELTPLIEYLQSIDKRRGSMSAAVGVLDSHLIPLKLVRRAWAAERAAARARCDALANAVGNGGYPALVKFGRQVAGEPTTVLLRRSELPLPIAQWAFDADNLGLVSPPIETAAGFSLVSTYRIEEGITRTEDRAEVYEVRFETHEPRELLEWLTRTRTDLAHQATFVHPDYRGSLPSWLEAR